MKTRVSLEYFPNDCRTTAASKTEVFVTLVNGKPLNNVTNSHLRCCSSPIYATVLYTYFMLSQCREGIINVKYCGLTK